MRKSHGRDVARLWLTAVASVMERESSGYRGMGFSGGFARPGTERRVVLNLLRFARAHRGLHARKIFVIKHEGRLHSRTGEGKTVRSILIFDDHPSSIRLVLARDAHPRGGPAAQPTSRWWEPFLGGMLIIGAVLVIFLPLFLKLSS
jgi:hypothetical protein